jgi:hypothetical protein
MRLSIVIQPDFTAEITTFLPFSAVYGDKFSRQFTNLPRHDIL